MSDVPRPRPRPVDLPVARPERVMVAISTAPDRESASNLARTLVEERLAACVNLIEPLTSIYRWNGQIQESQEFGLIIKTVSSRITALEARLRELHPYELPELLAWEPSAGSVAFMDWVMSETRRPRLRAQLNETPAASEPHPEQNT